MYFVYTIYEDIEMIYILVFFNVSCEKLTEDEILHHVMGVFENLQFVREFYRYNDNRNMKLNF